MATIALPSSDLTATGKPYVVGVEFAGDQQQASFQLALRRAEPGSEAIEASADWPDSAPPRLDLEIDVDSLAAGEYAGELTVTVGDNRQCQPISFYRLPTQRQDEFPFGIYATPFPPETDAQDELLQQLHAAGINLICQHMNGVASEGPFFDRAARFGIRFCPSDKLRWKDCPDELAVSIPDPLDRGRHTPCLNHPEVREEAVRRLAEDLAEYQAHAGFSGMMYYGDDLFLPGVFRQGESFLSCYCDYCTEEFRQLTGLEAPKTTEARIGIVPADDPWLQWTRHRCDRHYGDFVRGIEAAKERAAPGVALGLCHGWPDNPFAHIATGLYGPLTQPTKVVSSYCYPFLRSPAQDFICHYEIGKMGNRGKDVWMLGVMGADRTMVPPWQVYQNYWNMLAAGYKFIAFFSWHDYAGIMAQDDPEQHRRAQASLAALARCGEHKDWVLPTARHWEDVEARHAILFSFTTESFDIAPLHRGNRHSREVCRLYRLALRRQLPLKVICEEEILAGILAKFDAVCLHDVRALADNVHQVLQQYAADGGTVLLDSDLLYTDAWHPAVKTTIEGALEMSPESMIEHLSDRQPAAISVSNPDVTLRRLASGAVEYCVLVNNYADRYHGMPYTYGDPDRNYAHAALVRESAAEATVAFETGGRWLFDQSTGEPLGTTDTPLTLSLTPSWGSVVALLLCPAARLVVDLPEEAAQGETVRCGIELVDEHGDRIDGAFSVKVSIAAPTGRQSPYDGFIGLRRGSGEFLLPLGANDEIGAWRLSFEGGFPRRKISAELTVRGAPELAELLSLHQRT